MPDIGNKSWSDESGMYDDQVIDAAYLHSYPNCYFIGPFAKRVSFASQQFRAIDLVGALRRKGKLTPEKSVAVIGAGLAGLMTTAALLGLRCKKVHLYEAKGAMHRQTAARHRVVHPTISRWPMELLSLTTNFPFLDWFAAPCDRIIECLMVDWNENLNPEGSTGRFKFNKTHVQDLVFTSGPDQGRVKLKTSPQVKDRYDIVFVTTGFGDEHTIGEFKATSYWTLDDIARWSPEELRQWREGNSSILVSGCGDGGLIDCLRIIHGDFRDGWLTIELAEMLGPGFKGNSLIASAEHDALMAARSIACMPVKPDFHEDAVRSEKYIKALSDAYDKVVTQLPQQVRRLLNDSIAASGIAIGRVKLVAKEPFPFVPYAAPIHKLMIAHALESGHISYESAQVDYRNGIAHVAQRNGKKYDLPADALFVVRHGAPANMIGLISEEELASLKIRQLLMADYIDRKAERILDPPQDYPNRNVVAERFIASRYRMAKALVNQVAPQFRLTTDQNGFRYVRTGTSAPEGDASAPVRVQLPNTLFGIAAKHADLNDDVDHCLL